MKKIDKLRKQRYELSMKINDLEFKEKRSKLTKNEESELQILRDKESDINGRINEIDG